MMMSDITLPLMVDDCVCFSKLGRLSMARILTHEMRDEKKIEKKATRKEDAGCSASHAAGEPPPKVQKNSDPTIAQEQRMVFEKALHEL